MNIKPRKLILTSLAAFSLLISACGQQEALQNSNDGVDEMAKATETAVGSIGGMADEATGTYSGPAISSTFSSDVSQKQECFDLAVYGTCNSGIKQVTYNSCAIPGANGSLDGLVQLNFSEIDCSMSSAGKSVNRVYDLSYTSVIGREYITTSAQHSDFQGTSVGGGGQLTRTNSGYEVEILGKRRLLKGLAGQTLMDVSIYTTSPIELEGTLARTNRRAVGGEIVVAHNRAKFTTSMKPINLQWSDACCHPIAGQLSVVLRGSRNSSGLIEFQGCGKAELVLADEVRNLSLDQCQ